MLTISGTYSPSLSEYISRSVSVRKVTGAGVCCWRTQSAFSPLCALSAGIRQEGTVETNAQLSADGSSAHCSVAHVAISSTGKPQSSYTPHPPLHTHTVMYIHPTLYNSRCKWVGLLQCMYACTVCIVYVCAYVRVRACTCVCLYELRTSVILRRLGGWDVFSNDSRRIIKVRNGLKAQGFFYFFIFLWKRICHRDPYLMSKDPKSTQLTAEREVGECKCVCVGGYTLL